MQFSRVLLVAFVLGTLLSGASAIRMRDPSQASALQPEAPPKNAIQDSKPEPATVVAPQAPASEKKPESTPPTTQVQQQPQAQQQQQQAKQVEQPVPEVATKPVEAGKAPEAPSTNIQPAQQQQQQQQDQLQQQQQQQQKLEQEKQRALTIKAAKANLSEKLNVILISNVKLASVRAATTTTAQDDATTNSTAVDTSTTSNTTTAGSDQQQTQSTIIVQMYADNECTGERIQTRAFAVGDDHSCQLTSDFENIHSYSGSCETEFMFRITLFSQPCVGQDSTVLQTRLTDSACVPVTGTEKFVKAIPMCVEKPAASASSSIASSSVVLFTALCCVLTLLSSL